MNTGGEHELELAVYQAEPENQAGPVPGPDPEQKKFKIFFHKMPVHYVKGQPAVSTYVREKGGVTFDTNHGTPCMRVFCDHESHYL